MASRVSLLFLSALFLHAVSYSEASHRVWDDAELKDAKTRAQSSSSAASYRTAFHFQPAKGWMNDPNAPLFYKGYYHLFYQYNPAKPVWGLIRWGHAVSRDLINWRHLAGAALEPDEWYDSKGAWSGSATFVHKNGAPIVLYTGNNNASQQVQILALPKNSSDPFLREWRKVSANPVILPERGINTSSFRDPTTAWLGADQTWRILVGNKKDVNRRGMALLYKSKDFLKWDLTDLPLHSAAGTGMWECPDFFPVSTVDRSAGLDTSANGESVKHVLKNSLDDFKVDYYTLGTYFADSDRYVPDKGSVEGPDGLRYDYGKFYASKSFYDPIKERRILWGWINESDSVADDYRKGWASLQAIPRTVTLDPLRKNSLLQWPVPEIESLRDSPVTTHRIVLKARSLQMLRGFHGGASQVDVEAEFELTSNSSASRVYQKVDKLEGKTAQSLCVGSRQNMTEGGFGVMVLASEDMRERSAVFFKFFADSKPKTRRKVALCVDQSRSSLHSGVDKSSYGGFVGVPRHKRSVSLRILVDRTIVESFAEGGRTVITSRSYPRVAVGEKARLAVFNHMQSDVVLRKLHAWPMRYASHLYERR